MKLRNAVLSALVLSTGIAMYGEDAIPNGKTLLAVGSSAKKLAGSPLITGSVPLDQGSIRSRADALRSLLTLVQQYEPALITVSEFEGVSTLGQLEKQRAELISTGYAAYSEALTNAIAALAQLDYKFGQ